MAWPDWRTATAHGRVAVRRHVTLDGVVAAGAVGGRWGQALLLDRASAVRRAHLRPCGAGIASQRRTHWTQVALEIGRERRAALQVVVDGDLDPPMPRSGAQATPAMGRPAATPAQLGAVDPGTA